MVMRGDVRRVNISRVVNDYPGLVKIPIKSESYKEFVFEVMEKFGVSERTAKEYLKIAKWKLERSNGNATE